jgi:hypothetical protein
MTRKPSGQTLVLFALTLLLLTMLVLMTLSFGSKVKSRMEVQTVADATAYSNAVSAARTMNSIAVMNRVHVAHTVSTIGTLSLISWVTLYMRHAENGARLWLFEMFAFIGGLIWCICPGPCNPPACRACIRGIIETAIAYFLMNREANRVRGILNNDTVLFQNETTPRWLASAQIHADQISMINTYKARTNAGAFTTSYAANGNLRGVTPLTAPSTLNDLETTNAVLDTPAGPSDQPYHASMIVNASRGHPFIPRRTAPSGPFSSWAVKLSFPWVLLAAGWVFSTGSDTGRGYLNDTWVSSITGLPQGHPYGSWAQDWGGTTRNLLIKPYGPMCNIFGPLALAIGLIGRATGNQVKVGPWQHPLVHNVQHSYYTFPPFIDYNPGGTIKDTDDIYAQPKNMSMVSADPTIRQDPWETKGNAGAPGLKFKMSATSGGGSFDMVNEPASHTANMQNAIGSGVTYYSRPGHFTEPPNLFAPYWRSGLTRMTVDRPAAGVGRGAYDADLKTMFNTSGQTEAAAAFDELVRAGYKGFE